MVDKTVSVVLVGNPDTGKSTLFNALTGLRQHTGNWSGKTVSPAKGYFKEGDVFFEVYDLPSGSSLLGDKGEEIHEKELICFDKQQITVVVLDATCLEKDLPLALHMMEITDRVVLCLNLMDEAKKMHIEINVAKLEETLGVPILCTNARKGTGVLALRKILAKIEMGEYNKTPIATVFSKKIEEVFSYLGQSANHLIPIGVKEKDFFYRLMADEDVFYQQLLESKKMNHYEVLELMAREEMARRLLEEGGDNIGSLREERSVAFLKRTEDIVGSVLEQRKECLQFSMDKLDDLLLSKKRGIFLILFLFISIFCLTIVGATYFLQLFWALFGEIGIHLENYFEVIQVPVWLEGLLLDGVLLTVRWVVAITLPPMLIFFPFFKLLEDFGLLPRIVFLFDGLFQKAGANGKQILSMFMGFGCNVAGVTACRMIEMERERLIAILTNTFVPCNGKIPTMIVLTMVFFAGGNVIVSGVCILSIFLLSVGLTLFISKGLRETILKGAPSSFVVELPRYRRPEVGKVFVRSFLDRTAFVLGRAITVAIPAGAVLWLMQNATVGDDTIIEIVTSWLDPLGNSMGLSGMILLAFLLAIPANEIVLPILLMVYSQSANLVEQTGLAELTQILQANGWTVVTGICMVVFSLNHFPCTTTLLTIRKETGSLKWTVVAFLLPTFVGVVLCVLVQFISNFFSFFFF